ncbi:unnamed protein product [Eruca vesicaria subsp. sativa]|uniref:NHL domain-containing protein n=1 Tax=Eruca vesicaria subsp. sativa TaxID=29727 RepID=A0ABC8KN17_ERUVS|nr:unnamed protein product [Eruca vesicaria subsp. sativa]
MIRPVQISDASLRPLGVAQHGFFICWLNTVAHGLILIALYGNTVQVNAFNCSINICIVADSRTRLLTGSPEGYPGHVDGRLRDARLNNPKGLTVDDKESIYVADTVNNAIRKISEACICSLMFCGYPWDKSHNHCWGGKWFVGEEVMWMVRVKMQSFQMISMLFMLEAAVLCWLLAVETKLLERSNSISMTVLISMKVAFLLEQDIYKAFPDQKPLKSARPPVIQTRDEQEQQEESFLMIVHIAKLNLMLFQQSDSDQMLLLGMFPGLKKKQTVSFSFNYQETNHSSAYSTSPWPVQESFV